MNAYEKYRLIINLSSTLLNERIIINQKTNFNGEIMINMKNISSLKGTWLSIVAMLLFVALPVSAQNVTVKGTVADENGEPIIGANVTVVGNKTLGSISDFDGNFTIAAPANSTLEISFIGYLTQRVKVGSKSSYKIVLKEDAAKLDEVIVVGYGTQKKATLTGAISQIGNEELQMTKTQDTKNMLTGKIPGVRVTQNTSEPGEFGKGNFDIRGYGGSPLIVVDGVPRGNFERIDPNEVESISVLKDASAAVYGVRGGNGVILVTTKKGDSSGKAKVEYNMYYGIQTPSEVLRPVSSVDRMILFNEKSMRNLTDPRITYGDESFAPYLNGEKVSTDWYDAVIDESAPQQQHNLSVSGGSNKVNYFLNFGYMDQKGFLKSNSLDYNRYNFRSNLSAEVLEGLTVSAKVGFTIDERYRPYTDTWEIFKALWRSVPDDPVYANNNPAYLYKPSDIQNPVGMMDDALSGYKKNRTKLLSSTFEAEWAVPWVKGLKIKGLFSYDNTISDNETWKKAYDEYTYVAATDSYSPYTRQSPTNLNRYYGNSWTRLWQAQINYDNTFGKHHVTGMLAVEEAYSKGDNISANRNFAIPLPYLFAGEAENQEGTASAGGIYDNANRGYIGRFNYDYAGKYMAEFSFRYDGSSRFPKDNKWGFFPSVSAGWRISEESFIKDNLTFVDNLKIRASYGEMGHDGTNFQWITGYDYPNTSGGKYNNYSKGYMFGGSVVNSLAFRSVPNPDITWYTLKTLNVGIDADMWNGLLGVTFEVFQRDQDGIIGNRNSTVPGTFGASMPQENLNSNRTKGVELELRHHNRIGDFTYSIAGNVSYTRTQNRYIERNPSGNSFANWQDRNNTNRYNDIWFGYGAAGRYTSLEQIAHSDIFANSSTLPGDYIYEDWNGDGTIDSMDKYPIATTLASGSFEDFQNKRNYPLMNFGINLNASWKGFDLSMNFQGAAMSYIALGEAHTNPLLWNGNALDTFLDRWHPADPTQDPYDPTVQWISGYHAYGAITPDNNSMFIIQKGDYLRLKTLELGYTFPKKWTRFVGVQNLRIYMNGYNLLTFTGVKGVDPEKPADLFGYMYPLNKTYNFGASITF